MSVLEETCEADSIVSQMWFFADNDDVVFPSLDVELHEFLNEANSHHAQADDDNETDAAERAFDLSPQD